MKVIQTNNQIEVRSSGIGQLIIGLVIGLAGIALTIFVFAGPPDDKGNKMPIWVAAIGLAIIAAGVGMLLFSKNRNVVIQQGGTTTVTAKRIIGGQTENLSFPTSDITSVRLSTYIDNTTSNTNMQNNNMQRRSVLQLVLKNNDLVDIGGSGGGNSTFNGMNIGGLLTKAPLSKEADQIASFLNVPLDANDTSSIAGAVKSVTSAFQGNKPSNPQQPTEFNPEAQNTTPQPPSTPISPTPPQAPQPTPPVPPQEPPVVKPPDVNQPPQ